MMAIPLVSSLVQLAEKAVTGVKQGAVKKQLVVDGVNTLASGMAAMSNGGQKDTWTAIGQIAPVLIDPLVEIMNAGSRLISGQDLFEVPKVETATSGRGEA